MGRRTGGCGVAGLAACAALAAAPGGTAAQGPDHAWCPEPEAREFDFWLGEWDVQNRNRPADGETWYDTGRATNRVYGAVGGCAVVEHWRGYAFPSGGHIAGFSVRTWDPEASEWDLVLLWPVGAPPRFGNSKGTFRDGVGDFRNRWAAPGGDSVTSRLYFTDIGPDAFRWSNGVSSDGGETWSASWIMDATRRPPGAAGLWNGPSMTAARCPGQEHRAFDPWLGEWEGVRVDAAGDSAAVLTTLVRILDGCAVMQRTARTDGRGESFSVRAFEAHRGGWTAYATASDRRGMRRREGGADGADLVLVDVERAGGTWTRSRWSPDGPLVVELREVAAGPDGPWRLLDRTRWRALPGGPAGG